MSVHCTDKCDCTLNVSRMNATERFEVRIHPEERQALDEISSAMKISRSEVIKRAIRLFIKASGVVDHHTITLTRDEFERLKVLLQEPPVPNETLTSAAKAYRRRYRGSRE